MSIKRLNKLYLYKETLCNSWKEKVIPTYAQQKPSKIKLYVWCMCVCIYIHTHTHTDIYISVIRTKIKHSNPDEDSQGP